MSLGLLAALQHAARRMKADNDRLRDRVDARMQKAGARAEDGSSLDLPQEGLACPRCRARYAFGGTCPDCNEPLVSVSFIDVGPELPPPPRWHGFVLGGAIAVFSVGLTLLLHIIVEWMTYL